MKKIIGLIISIAMLISLAACGEGGGGNESGEMTFSVGVVSNDKIQIKSTTSTPSVPVSGAPVTSNPVKIK